MRLKGFENIRNIYFIGIGGISMSALAKYASVCGYTVSGSDSVRSEQTEQLAFYGVKVHIGIAENNVELMRAELVVYTDAIPIEHTELVFARKQGKNIIARADFLKAVCQGFPWVVSVAGSHGKTTCTSMCAHVLKSAEVPFTAHIGGEDLSFGNFYSSGEEYFVTEACEYKKNLLKIQSNTAILLNIDNDHMECYKNEEDLLGCFKSYCLQAKTAFVCADDERSMRLGDFATFGIVSSLCDYRAVDLRAIGERYAFTVEEYGKPLCRIRLKAVGRHAVYNALATFAGMRSLGFNEREIRLGLESFEAVKRRFEKIGAYHGASFICDYAHHPREVEATFTTAKGLCRGRLLVVFQPHTYSRTKLLMQEFVKVLRRMDDLIIYKTYPARETYDEQGSAERLSKEVGSLYAENTYVLKTWLKKTVREGDMVLFLGAGDIYYVAQYLLKDLK